MSNNPSRRLFLAASGGLAGAAGLSPAAAMAGAAPADAIPFHGPHQAGIATPMQPALYFAAFDLAPATTTAGLITLLQNWTNAADRLTAGLPAEPGTQNPDAPALDSGEAMGINASHLTLTFGFGPDLFALPGLSTKRPDALPDLPRFAGDQLVPGQCGGALAIQACADDPQIAFHAVRQLARIAYGAVALKWVQDGFSAASKTKGTGRNLMGFKDGTMNPAGAALAPVIWAGAEGPAWMQNGSYMVTRRIRIALEHWDRMAVAFQEQTFGRQKISGAPLGGTHEFETPNFAATDANGDTIIPETAHVRLAAAANNDGTQILRRSYSYNAGANFVAERWPPWRQGIEYDAGLFFQCYQRDPRSGFIKLFDKISKIDALNQFTTHTGSAIFACPPGAQQGEFIGQKLFEA